MSFDFHENIVLYEPDLQQFSQVLSLIPCCCFKFKNKTKPTNSIFALICLFHFPCAMYSAWASHSHYFWYKGSDGCDSSSFFRDGAKKLRISFCPKGNIKDKENAVWCNNSRFVTIGESYFLERRSRWANLHFHAPRKKICAFFRWIRARPNTESSEMKSLK